MSSPQMRGKTPALRSFPSLIPWWFFGLFALYALISSMGLLWPYRGAESRAWLPFLLAAQVWNLAFLATAIFALRSLPMREGRVALSAELLRSGAVGLYAVGWVAWGLPLGWSPFSALFVGGLLLLLLAPAQNTERRESLGNVSFPFMLFVPWGIAVGALGGVVFVPAVLWDTLVWAYLLFFLLSSLFLFSQRLLPIFLTKHPTLEILAPIASPEKNADSPKDSSDSSGVFGSSLRRLFGASGASVLSLRRLLGVGLIFVLFFFPPLLGSDAFQSLRTFSYVRATQGTTSLGRARHVLLRELHRWPHRLHESQSQTFHRLQQAASSLDAVAAIALLRVLAHQSGKIESIPSSRFLVASLRGIEDRALEGMRSVCRREPNTAHRAQQRLLQLLLTPVSSDLNRPLFPAMERLRYAPVKASHIALLSLFHDCLPKNKRLDLSVLWVLFLDASITPETARAAQKTLGLSAQPSPHEAYEHLLLHLPKDPKPAFLAYLFASMARSVFVPHDGSAVRLKALLRGALQGKHPVLRDAALLVLHEHCLSAPVFFAPLGSLLRASELALRLSALRVIQRFGDPQCRAPQKTSLHPAFSTSLVASSPKLLPLLFDLAKQEISPELQTEARRFLYRLSAEDLGVLRPKMLALLGSEQRAGASWWLLPLLLRFPSLPEAAQTPLIRLLQRTQRPLFQQAVFDAMERIAVDPTVLLGALPPAPLTPESAHLWRAFQQRIQQRPSLVSWLLSQAKPAKSAPSPAHDIAFLQTLLAARRLSTLATSRPVSQPSKRHVTTQPSTAKKTPVVSLRDARSPATRSAISSNPSASPLSSNPSASPLSSNPSASPLQSFEEHLAVLLEKEGVIAHYNARLALWELFSSSHWPVEQIVHQALPALYPPLLTLGPRRKHTHLFLLRLLGRLGADAAPALPVLRRLLVQLQDPRQLSLRVAIAHLLPVLQKEARPLRSAVYTHYQQSTDSALRVVDILMLARLGDTARALRLLRRECSAASPTERFLAWRSLLQESTPHDGFLLPLLLDALRWFDPLIRRDALSILDLLQDAKARHAAIQQAIALSPPHRDYFTILQQRYVKP